MTQKNIRNLVILPEYSWVHDLIFHIDMETRNLTYSDIIWILENNDFLQLMDVAFSSDVQGSGFFIEVALSIVAVTVHFIKENKINEFRLLRNLSPLDDFSRIHAYNYIKKILSLTMLNKDEERILRLAIITLWKEV